MDRSSIYGGFHLHRPRGSFAMSTRASALGGGGDRRLMDSIYRRQRHIYDFSRNIASRRDRLIAELNPPNGSRVLETAAAPGAI